MNLVSLACFAAHCSASFCSLASASLLNPRICSRYSASILSNATFCSSLSALIFASISSTFSFLLQAFSDSSCNSTLFSLQAVSFLCDTQAWWPSCNSLQQSLSSDTNRPSTDVVATAPKPRLLSLPPPHVAGAAGIFVGDRVRATEGGLLEFESHGGSNGEAINNGAIRCSLTNFSAKFSSIRSYFPGSIEEGLTALLLSFDSLCCFSLNTSHHFPSLLAVRPGTSAAIFFHLFPCLAWRRITRRCSSSDSDPFLMPGLR
ncbi:putative protein rough sheath 2-like protein [Iris pallida]|uniref:Secreted protein n=1 Tax=Iris pallida TaxID=29817 RepID=A0AAX6G8K8_IRIPA|nr:putative protein rough sheath 2-like protein [Iris pallida]